MNPTRLYVPNSDFVLGRVKKKCARKIKMLSLYLEQKSETERVITGTRQGKTIPQSKIQSTDHSPPAEGFDSAFSKAPLCVFERAHKDVGHGLERSRMRSEMPRRGGVVTSCGEVPQRGGVVFPVFPFEKERVGVPHIPVPYSNQNALPQCSYAF
jgi:hypothetical protein